MSIACSWKYKSYNPFKLKNPKVIFTCVAIKLYFLHCVFAQRNFEPYLSQNQELDA